MKGTINHELKVWREFYCDLYIGVKNFEVRKNDKNFKVGDTLLLREFDKDADLHTGSFILRDITYILNGGQFGIEEGYVVLGLEEAA